MIFPSTRMQVLSAMIHFLGVSFLAHCLSRRANVGSLSSFFAMSWARICVVLVFVDSWLFLFISGVIIFGVGLEYNLTLCSMAIYLCIACYGSSKLFIYFFLVERVYVVWAPAGGKRFKSPIYVFCFITIVLYGSVVALLIWGRIHYFRDDGACRIGLKKPASVSLLSYDLFINVLLTSLFLWPLLRSRFLNLRIRRVATRTLLAAGAALTTSTVNIAVLTIQNGEQLGWVCLGSCGTDVLFNALAIYWVTGGSGASRPTTTPVDTTQKILAPADNADSDRRLVASAPGVNVSFPSPVQASTPSPQPGATSTQNRGVDAEGDRNEDARRPSFFKSIWSKIWKGRVDDDRLGSGIIEISVCRTTEHEMDPLPRNENVPRSLRKVT